MRKLFYILGLMITVSSASAQDPHFSQFFASPLTLNPAFTGKFDGIWRLAANHRDQWPSIPKAYVTTSASVDFPILKNVIPQGDVFGVGVSGLSDVSGNGALKLNYGSLSLSYHKAFDEDGFNTLGVGFQGTYSSLGLDVTKLTFEDELQQNGFSQGTSAEYIGVNPLSGRNRNYTDFSAGFLFSGSSNGENNYYFGVSMYHINRPKISFKDREDWNLSSRITVHGGGTFPLSDALDLNVSLLHQAQSKSSETVLGGALAYNLNSNAETPTSIYMGSWLRIKDAIIPYIGLEIGSLRIGASYDINTSGLKSASLSKGGSEFSIIYIQKAPENKGIPCPKF